MDGIALHRVGDRRQGRRDVGTSVMEAGDLAGECSHVGGRKDARQRFGALHLGVEHAPAPPVVPGVRSLVDDEHVGQEPRPATMAQQRGASRQTVVVFGEEKVRAVRRHLGNQRGSIAELHSKHPVGGDVRTHLGGGADASGVIDTAGVVLPRLAHDVFGVAKEGIARGRHD